MFSPGTVCLSLFVCEQDNSKTYGRILMKFSGYVRKSKRKKLLNFGSDPDHYLDLLDPGIGQKVFHIYFIYACVLYECVYNI